jgi:hypothetical protein
MDYAHWMVCCLLGFAPAFAVFYLLRPKRRAWIPPLAWWLSLGLGVVIFFYGISHSTMPSFSTRITAVGKAYSYVQREIHTGYHHDTIHGFRFVPDGGEPINIETEIILPDWGTPANFDGRTFRIVYLKDSQRVLKNEAIDIAILSGKNAGYHDSLDARPFGSWLAIPIGAAFFGFGFIGLKYMNDDAKSAASDEDDNPST